MQKTVAIDQDAIREIAARLPADSPIVMFNALRFRERADYGDRSDVAPCSGREAYYERYAAISSPLVVAGGGEIVYFGGVVGNVIAPGDERWDDFILVKYASFSQFQALMANSEYQAGVFHRTAALEDSRLIATRPQELPI